MDNLYFTYCNTLILNITKNFKIFLMAFNLKSIKTEIYKNVIKDHLWTQELQPEASAGLASYCTLLPSQLTTSGTPASSTSLPSSTTASGDAPHFLDLVLLLVLGSHSYPQNFELQWINHDESRGVTPHQNRNSSAGFHQ